MAAQYPPFLQLVRVISALADLSGAPLPNPSAVDGALVYCEAVGEYYRFSINSGAAIDGTTVLSTQAGGASRWLKTGIASGGSLPVVVPFTQQTANYAINPATDYHITFAVFGANCTLPPNPVNGESYEITSTPGNVTVLLGNGHFINGGVLYTQSAGETTSVRFNGATSEWEIC